MHLSNGSAPPPTSRQPQLDLGSGALYNHYLPKSVTASTCWTRNETCAGRHSEAGVARVQHARAPLAMAPRHAPTASLPSAAHARLLHEGLAPLEAICAKRVLRLSVTKMRSYVDIYGELCGACVRCESGVLTCSFDAFVVPLQG